MEMFSCSDTTRDAETLQYRSSTPTIQMMEPAANTAWSKQRGNLALVSGMENGEKKADR